MNTLNFIVRNTNSGRLVHSFDTSQKALDFVAANGAGGEGPLGPLAAFGLETITREFPLVENTVVPIKRVRVGR